MQNTYHYLANFAPKMRSITGTVYFTDSTVYSELSLCLWQEGPATIGLNFKSFTSDRLHHTSM